MPPVAVLIDPVKGTFRVVAQTDVSPPPSTIGIGVMIRIIVSDALLQLAVAENISVSMPAVSGMYVTLSESGTGRNTPEPELDHNELVALDKVPNNAYPDVSSQIVASAPALAVAGGVIVTLMESAPDGQSPAVSEEVS